MYHKDWVEWVARVCFVCDNNNAVADNHPKHRTSKQARQMHTNKKSPKSYYIHIIPHTE